MHRLGLHFWIPRHSDENRVNAAAQRRREYVANLKANEEGKCNDNGSVTAIRVVRWRCEDEVEICKQGARVCNEGGTHAEYRADKTLVDEGINTAVLDHSSRR